MDERVTQYFCLYSWSFWTIAQRESLNQLLSLRLLGLLRFLPLLLRLLLLLLRLLGLLLSLSSCCGGGPVKVKDQ